MWQYHNTITVVVSYIHSQYSLALFIADVGSRIDGKWEPKRVPTTHEIEVNTYTVQYN